MDVDWSEIVDLEMRGTQRPDASYRFSRFASGSLADMVWRALARDDRDRQRVVIVSPKLGRIENAQINALASRPDFPRRRASVATTPYFSRLTSLFRSGDQLALVDQRR